MVDEADVDTLFQTPPAQFIAARNALVAKAQAAGQRERARQIRGFRKPTVVVWLVNQLARGHPAEVAALLAAGKHIRQASFGGSAALREANDAWRGAVAGALRLIREIAGSAIDEPRIVATLTGAAADPVGAKLLVKGRLMEELRPPGIEGALGNVAKPPTSSGRKAENERAAGKATSKTTRRAERQRQRDREKELREREREATKAMKEAARADEVAAHLERRAKTAAEAAAAARKAAEEAAKRSKELAVELKRPP
jgi:hypothetical protein